MVRLEILEERQLLAAVVAVSPAANSHQAKTTGEISLTFDASIDAATVNPTTLFVLGEQTGQRPLGDGELVVDGITVRFTPNRPFMVGELVQVVATAGIHDAEGAPIEPYVWQFATQPIQREAAYQQIRPPLQGDSESWRWLTLGDVDGDRDLDLFVGVKRDSSGTPSLWINDGDGRFAKSDLFNVTFAGASDIVLGDVNGDGVMELLVAQSSPGSGPVISIWGNSGGGEFYGSGAAVFGIGGFDLELGDVDRDGDLDLLSTGQRNAILLNDGTGTFTDSGQDLGVSWESRAALGDLDGDGDLDAFIANGAVEDATYFNSVWLNDGHGVFADTGQRLRDRLGRTVRLGDLDNDGDLDAFVTVADYRTLSSSDVLYHNDGAGAFHRVQSISGPHSSDAQLADFDGDGFLDLLLGGDSGGGTARLYLNDGSGRVVLDQSFDEAEYVTGLVEGDLNGDGDLDLLLSETNDGIQVWHNGAVYTDLAVEMLNDSSEVRPGDVVWYLMTVRNLSAEPIVGATVTSQFAGSVTDVQWTSVATAGSQGTSAGAGPVADVVTLAAGGSIDYHVRAVVAAHAQNHLSFGAQVDPPAEYIDERPTNNCASNSDLVTWLLGDGGGAMLSQGLPATGRQGYAIELGDLDGDGDLDAFGREDGAAYVWNNTGSSEFVETQRWTIFANVQTEIVDIDSDGDLDVISGPYLFRNTGTGEFDVDTLPVSGEVFATGDFDGDGVLDVFVTSGTFNSYLLHGNGFGGFVAKKQPPLTYGAFLAPGDVEGDGDLDLLFGFSPRSHNLLLNDGHGTFEVQNTLIDDGFTRPKGAEFADLDDDGDLDLFLVGSDRPIWLNNGAGQFIHNGDFYSGVFGQAAKLGDVDGDGDLDVVFDSHLLSNDGTAHFVVRNHTLSLAQMYPQDVALGDLDGDGDLDGLVSVREFNGRSLYLLKNFNAVVDLGVQISDSRSSVAAGESMEYTITVRNQGPDAAIDATVSLELSPGLDDLAWTATGSEGTVYATSGADVLADTVTIPAGGSIEYVLHGTLPTSFVDGYLTAMPRVDLPFSDPALYADVHPADNAAIDNNLVLASPVTSPGGRFVDSGQRLGNDVSLDAAAGDLDGDGDADLIVASLGPRGAIIYRNDAGRLAEVSAGLGLANSVAVKLADLDGDDDLDAFFAAPGGNTSVWRNDGDGNFTDSGQRFALADNVYVALADFDGDGDLDALLGQGSGLESALWWNDGQGRFADRGRRLPVQEASRAVAADIDGDSDVDFVVNSTSNGEQAYWSNDGQGNFSPATLKGIGGYWRIEAIGDLNGDGRNDIVAVGDSTANVFLRTATGNYEWRQRSGQYEVGRVELGDLDGDSDLDLYLANGTALAGVPDTIVWNLGNGDFQWSTQELSPAAARDVALADFDRDGDLDAYVANGRLVGGQPDEVWLNGPILGDTYPFDGVVDLADLNRVRNNFGAAGLNVEGDANGDGSVDLADLNLVRNHFGGVNSGGAALLGESRVVEPHRSVAGKATAYERSTDLLLARLTGDGTAACDSLFSPAPARRRK